MAIKHINIGAAPNDKTGTTARQAGQMINENFDYLDGKISNVNKIITPGTYVLVGQNLTIRVGWVWEINGQQFFNPEDVVVNFPYAATGKQRLDRIVFNTSNTFTKVVGMESMTNPFVEPIPADTIDFGISLITDSAVGEITPPESLENKLDKGGYTGTAQTLADAIDAVFVPDQLISAVPPTRSVNTFTYPALGYTALISKTLRINPAQFITTITAASTTNHKRVDLIYFKSDNTLAKLVGTEDLIIAPRPDVPAGSVGVSFINVFGDVIDTPTPITDEISIQNYFGVEVFRITDYMRFKNVSFDVAAKAIIIDGLVPLSAFLDPINGNDTTAVLENSNKPFKTFRALQDALPVYAGETYTIYITGGTIPIIRRVQVRSFNWVAYTPVTLDFTNCMADNGTDHAPFVTVLTAYGNIATWDFKNSNISIYCGYTSNKAFSQSNGVHSVRIKGIIDLLDWRGWSSQNYVGCFQFYGLSEFTINDLYENNPFTVTYLASQGGYCNIRVLSYRTNRGTKIYECPDGSLVTLEKLTQVGTTAFTFAYGLGTVNADLILGDVNFNVLGKLVPRSKSIVFKGSFNANVNIDFLGCGLISGNLTSVNTPTNSFLDTTQEYRNYNGKLGNILFAGNTVPKVIFNNSNIITPATLFINTNILNNNRVIVEYSGFNSLIQSDTTKKLFDASYLGNNDIIINISDSGTLKTNAKTLGIRVNYTNTTATFKEKMNEVVIRSKTDLVNKTLISQLTYVIDTTNFGAVSGDYILMPANGLTIVGYGFDTSVLNKNVAGEALFKSPVGGSGNLILKDLKIDSGAGSVFDIEDSNGSHAIEFNDVNFENCASWGKIRNYRQFTGQTIGMYNCLDGLTLSGTWNGFVMSKLHVRGLAATGTLFKKDTDTVFTNRFALGVNLSGVTGIKVLDFDNTIFTRNRMLQLDDCTFEINGIIDESNTSALIPNIGPNDPKCKWSNSEGITLTALLFLDMKSPDGNIWRVTVSNSGVLTVTDI